MFAFLDKYLITIILCGIGAFLVIVTYGANRAGRSGFPIIGGLLIAAGFLISPWKWLALLGLLDYGPGYLAYLYISEAMVDARFRSLSRHNRYREPADDKDYCLVVKVPQINEELVRPYQTNSTYRYFVPKCFFRVCIDSAGKKVLILDRCRGDKKIDVIPFEGNRVVVTGMKHRLNDVTLEIEVKPQTDML